MRALPRALGALALLVAAACGETERVLDPPATVVVHASRALPASLADSIERIEGVRWTRLATTAMVNLVRIDGGVPLEPRDPDAILPFSIGAAEPLPDSRDLVSQALARGEAVIPPATVRLRALGLGDAITIGVGMERATLVVGGVVEDERVEGVEALIPMEVARALGITEVRNVIVGVDASERARVESAAESLAAPVPVRVGSREAIRSPEGSRLLSLAEIKERYGEFSFVPGSGRWLEPEPAWVAANIVSERVPVLGEMRCHRKIMPMLRAAMTEVEQRGLGSLIVERAFCYAPRVQFGDTRVVSRHTWGIAVDINPSTNAYGDEPTLDMRIVEIMQRHGFAWGGRWLIPDGMHFEAADD